MQNAILVINAGSSSIKFTIFIDHDDNLEPGVSGAMESIHTAARFIAKMPDGRMMQQKSWPEGFKLGHSGAIDHLRVFLRTQLADYNVTGVGHRVVHGGLQYTQAVRIDAAVMAALEKFIPLAPLHQPHNLSPIRLLFQRAPQLPQVACFDTAFHRTTPQVAQMYALPIEFYESGLLRYGFHGLSYEYIASVLAQYDAQAAGGRTIVMHLGNGASMCALQAGRSIANTMGFTAVEGLMMGTRCGTLDPGAVLYFMDQRGMDARAIEKLIYNQSGLLGVSGISNNMRTLLDSDDPRARLAIELYLYRIKRELGSLTAALGGLDAIVFTAGIGENAPLIRSRICQDATFAGVQLDAAANAAGGPRISTNGSRVAAWVIPTNEELMIARHTRRVLEG